MRSSSGWGMVSSALAVHMKSTCTGPAVPPCFGHHRRHRHLRAPPKGLDGWRMQGWQSSSTPCDNARDHICFTNQDRLCLCPFALHEGY